MQNFGYQQPDLPGPFSIQPAGDLILPRMKLLENVSTNAGVSKTGEGAGVAMFLATRDGGRKVVVKVPLTGDLFAREVLILSTIVSWASGLLFLMEKAEKCEFLAGKMYFAFGLFASLPLSRPHLAEYRWNAPEVIVCAFAC